MSDSQTPDNEPQIQVKPFTPPRVPRRQPMLPTVILLLAALGGGFFAFSQQSAPNPYSLAPGPQAAAPTAPRLPVTPYGGLGIGLNPSPQGAIVAHVYPGTPGEHAGLMAGDIITVVDGLNTAGMTVDGISARIKGPAGSSVSITYIRGNGAPQQATLTRELLQPDVFKDRK